MTRLARRLGVDGYHALHRISVEEPERFWPAVVEDLGIEFSQPWDSVVDVSRGPEWATWFVGGRINVARVCVHRWAEERPDAEALVWQSEDGRREALSWAEASRAGDAARRGARRARRGAGRPRRDLHADVPRGRGRIARMRARRRGAGADLLRLRGARDRVAARGLRSEGRPLRRLVAAAREAHRDAADAGRRRSVRRRARRRVEPGERRVARARDAAARNAAAARGRLRGAVSARLHVRHDGEAEGSAARAGRLPRLDRAGGRVPERRQGRRPPPFRHRHGLDHGAVDARRRRRGRRGDRLRRGRSGLADRSPLAARRVGARDHAGTIADARPRADPPRRAGRRSLVAEDVLHDRRTVESRSVHVAVRARRRLARADREHLRRHRGGRVLPVDRASPSRSSRSRSASRRSARTWTSSTRTGIRCAARSASSYADGRGPG